MTTQWQEPATWFTLVIAVFAIVQSAALVYQYVAINRQAKLMHHALVAQNRPKLEIRWLNMNPGMVFTDASYIDCAIVNTGFTQARIVDSWAGFQKIETNEEDKELPEVPPYGADRRPVGNRVVEPGADISFRFEVDPNNSSTVAFAEAAHRTGTRIYSGDFYFFGFLKYTDELGTPRMAGFCRHYDLIKRRFVKVDNPNYEYSN